MGKSTEISWCDHTFNTHWGCMKVSPGCENCYALTLAKRWGHDIWGPAKTTARRLFGSKHWGEPFVWDHEAQQAGVRRRVFCNSMADVFEDHPMLPRVREQLWQTIAVTPFLDWLLLTKRPENVAEMMPNRYWSNVWLGTSTEDQERANERVPLLVRMRDRASVLFLSVEPQLGPVHLAQWLGNIDWVITGGESGSRHRPFDLAWARHTRDECALAGVAWHFKQFGGFTHAAGGCSIDGREWKEFPNPAYPRKNTA
jgi:protein gp37